MCSAAGAEPCWSSCGRRCAGSACRPTTSTGSRSTSPTPGSASSATASTSRSPATTGSDSPRSRRGSACSRRPSIRPAAPVAVGQPPRADAHAALCDRWPRWRFPMRIGTGLWHGDKSALHLGANVIDFHPVKHGTVAGYHGSTVAADGTSRRSSAPAPPTASSRSPTGAARSTTCAGGSTCSKPPHMHTSMVLVPDGADVPAGRRRGRRPTAADLVSVDEVIWQ